MKRYDLVVIGGGPAGTPVALEYAKLNSDKKVLLVDKKGELGGECLFDGCIPSKILEVSSNHIKELKKLKDYGIDVGELHYKVVWEKIKDIKENILAQRSEAAKEMFPTNIEIVKATAGFVDHDKIDIDGEIISFGKCIVATGSKPFIPHYDGNGLEKIWTNDTFFDKMELPESLSIIGDGPIAIEFTQILSTLGVKINLIGRKDNILNKIDRDLSSIVLEKLKEDTNINLVLKANITQIDYEQESDTFSIKYTQDEDEKVIVSQRVLVATGRVANVEGLDLEKAGIKYDKKGILTDKHLLTSNKKIYANGDVVANFPKFAHTSFYSSHTIAQNLFLDNNIFSVDFEKNSWVLFSTPNIAVAGLSEEEAKKKNIPFLVGKYDFSTDAKAQLKQEKGFLKYIVEESSNKIIGIGIVLNDANNIAGEAALIVSKELNLSDIISTIHPHPTLSESFSNLAKNMKGKIIMEKLKNPFVKKMLEVERWL